VFVCVCVCVCVGVGGMGGLPLVVDLLFSLLQCASRYIEHVIL